MMSAHHSIGSAGSSVSTTSLPEQARLLQEAQTVVVELKEDMIALQRENTELRRRDRGEAALVDRVRELETCCEKQRKEAKEARLRLLRAQQDKKKLEAVVAEWEAGTKRQGSSGVAEAEIREKVQLLEAANTELRRENASLREQKLTFMTSELSRLHPSSRPPTPPGFLESENERLNSALNATIADLAAAKQKNERLDTLVASQETLLDRRAAEYESLALSRQAELETLNILTASLSETKELYEASQKELEQLQEANRDLQAELKLAEAAREREKEREEMKGKTKGPERKNSMEGASVSQEQSWTGPEDKTAEELKEELEMVKKTAGSAITTLSSSLKKALLQSQELCENFEKDRLAMKEENEAAHQRIAELEAQVEEQRVRTKEAKQRLKADILDTKQLIRSQQQNFKKEQANPSSALDPEILPLLQTPSGGEALVSPPSAPDPSNPS